MKTDKAARGEIDRLLARFSRRLSSILGEGRIHRTEKTATAEAAIKAVDDLVKAMEEEITGIDKRHDRIEPASDT